MTSICREIYGGIFFCIFVRGLIESEKHIINYMDNDIKITLTIQGMPGAVRKFVGKHKRDGVVFNDYEEVPCSQTIKMVNDAYEYFTSEVKPYWFHSVGEWKHKSKKDRLELHLARIASSYNGKSFSYFINED